MAELARLNVCFIAGTLGQGGAERQLFYILRALMQEGARPRLLCLTRGEYWEPKLREIGVPVTWVGQRASRLARALRMLQELVGSRPDVIQSQHFYTNLYAVAVARALGRREVGAIRNDGTHEVGATGRVAGRLSLHAPGTIAANSQAAIRTAIGLGVPVRRLRLLPNVVDTDRFQPAPGSRNRPVRLLAVGRLVQQKRFDRFLTAVARIHRSSRGFEAVIVGDGPLKSKLRQQASELGLLPETVCFRGSVADMAPMYRQADALVLTSDWEGTPNVLLEAMASGLPVVATRVGGVPEIIRHGETGYLVDPEDPADITTRVLELLDDPGRRRNLGSSAREYVLRHHSLQHLPVALTDLYNAVLP